MRPIKRTLFQTGVLALSLLALGCGTGESHGLTAAVTPTSSINVIGYGDGSVTFRNRIGQSLMAWSQLGRVMPSETRLKLFRFDSSVGMVFDGPIPRSQEAFFAAIVPSVKPLSDRENTYVHLALESCVREAAQSAGPVVVLIASDWYCDGMNDNDRERVSAAAKALYDNSKVMAVVVTGVDPKNSERVAHDLAPLGRKLKTPVTGTVTDLRPVICEVIRG